MRLPMYNLSPIYIKMQTKEMQSQVTPASAILELMAGNKRFRDQRTAERSVMEQVRQTAVGQYPFAFILSCIDSRIPAEMIFDQGIGDVFNARIAGNIVNDDIIGSMEYACKLAGAKTIMVLGHTSCGGVKGACDNISIGKLTKSLAGIKSAVNKVKTEPGEERTSCNTNFVDLVSEENVRLSVAKVTSGSKVLRDMARAGEISVVGAMYDVASGKVRLLE